MKVTDEFRINAPIARVWAVFTDVERWPEWTASVRTVELIEGDQLAVGTRARIDQPWLPVAIWEVTEIEPGRSWSWTSRAPGAQTTAAHTMTAADDASTLVRQTLTFSGPVGLIAAALLYPRTRKYLRLEAAGLARRCEAASRS